MTKLEQDEVLFEIKDGVEYDALRADTFRTAMRERAALRSAAQQVLADPLLDNASESIPALCAPLGRHK